MRVQVTLFQNPWEWDEWGKTWVKPMGKTHGKTSINHPARFIEIWIEFVSADSR